MPPNQQLFLQSTKILLAVGSLFTACACSFSCSEVTENTMRGQECNLVILRNTSAPRNLDISGYNPQTLQPATYAAGGGFYIDMISSLALHDTLIKKRGQDWFLLKKAGLSIRYSIKCSPAGEFIGVQQDTFRRSQK